MLIFVKKNKKIKKIKKKIFTKNILLQKYMHHGLYFQKYMYHD